MPTTNAAPPIPKNIAININCVYVSAKARATTGIMANRHVVANTIRPPNLSVIMPKMIRPNEPMMTGTAKSRDSDNGFNDNSLAYFAPNGLRSDHAQKLIIRATVAIIRVKYAERGE